jgi:hypothetical protein
VLPITISIIALLVTTVNACTGISNFVLSRFRLLRVREIASGYTHRGKPAMPTRHFTVDVLSYGAAIWDVEAQIEIFVPATKRNLAKGFSGTLILGLKPVGKYINPLNSGQGMIFEMWSNEMFGPDPSLKALLDDLIPHVPHKNFSLCVYCSEKRRLLRRVRHGMFRWQLDQFLGGLMKAKLPHYMKLYLNWKHRETIRSHGVNLNTRSRTWTPPK